MASSIDGTQVVLIGALIIYILAFTGLTAIVYTEQGASYSGAVLKDYSFSETSETSFSEISSLNQSNVKILSGEWNLSSGSLKFIHPSYLLFIFPQPGKVAFTNLVGKNNNTYVSNSYTIDNPPGNSYEVVILEGLDGGDKIKVRVTNTGFDLIELQSGILLPWNLETTHFNYPNPSSIENAEIITEFSSITGNINLKFNNQEIINQKTSYELSLWDTAFTEQRNYYGGLNSDNINFSVSKIQYQTTVDMNTNIDPLTIAQIMISLITNFNLPGLTDDLYGILFNVIFIKVPTIVLVILILVLIRGFLPF